MKKTKEKSYLDFLKEGQFYGADKKQYQEVLEMLTDGQKENIIKCYRDMEEDIEFLTIFLFNRMTTACLTVNAEKHDPKSWYAGFYAGYTMIKELVEDLEFNKAEKEKAEEIKRMEEESKKDL